MKYIQQVDWKRRY